MNDFHTGKWLSGAGIVFTCLLIYIYIYINIHYSHIHIHNTYFNIHIHNILYTDYNLYDIDFTFEFIITHTDVLLLSKAQSFHVQLDMSSILNAVLVLNFTILVINNNYWFTGKAYYCKYYISLWLNYTHVYIVRFQLFHVF